jgi:hypothetical protein
VISCPANPTRVHRSCASKSKRFTVVASGPAREAWPPEIHPWTVPSPVKWCLRGLAIPADDHDDQHVMPGMQADAAARFAAIVGASCDLSSEVREGSNWDHVHDFRTLYRGGIRP